jgi:hypothetical protein
MKKFAIIFPVIIMGITFLTIGNIKSADAVTAAKSPVVVELFTSQSCSSCPPADKVLNDLAAANDHIIALSCNVTYWNHLHWKDTLSKSFCTMRQQQYVQSLKARGNYTPQTVVNGRHEMVGSQRSKVLRAIASDLQNNPVKPIALNLSDETLTIDLPKVTVGQYMLILVSHGNEHTQSIPSGENRGRTVSYTNPVEHMKILGAWDGNAKTLNENITDIKATSGYVVLAQKDHTAGQIVAAGKVK